MWASLIFSAGPITLAGLIFHRKCGRSGPEMCQTDPMYVDPTHFFTPPFGPFPFLTSCFVYLAGYHYQHPKPSLSLSLSPPHLPKPCSLFPLSEQQQPWKTYAKVRTSPFQTKRKKSLNYGTESKLSKPSSKKPRINLNTSFMTDHLSQRVFLTTATS